MLFVLSSNTPTCHHISTNTLVSFSLFQATGKGIYASNTESLTHVIPSISVQLTAMTRLRKVLNCLLSSATCKLHQSVCWKSWSSTVSLYSFLSFLAFSPCLSTCRSDTECIIVYTTGWCHHIYLYNMKNYQEHWISHRSPHLYLKHDQLLLLLLLFRKHIAHQHQLGVKNLVVIA